MNPISQKNAMVSRTRLSDLTRSMHFEEGEILNVCKPIGMTSFYAVNRIKRWVHCTKAGHAGALDPLATGVLLVCTGKATRRVSELMSLRKTYEGVIELGKVTTTDDAEGELVEQKEVPDFSQDKINSVLRLFEGEIDQIPPMFSALKINGQRLYRLARRGIVVERLPRRIVIHEIILLNWRKPFITFRIRCSKGTYVRSLARDIGKSLGTGGYLKSLCRTEIGPYRLDEAYSMEEFKALFAIDADLQIH
jgi:tRNA pseudouridine55 synthase